MGYGRFFHRKGSGIMTNISVNLHVYEDSEITTQILDNTLTPVLNIDMVSIFLKDKATIDKVIEELQKLKERCVK
jgi:uncharacterized protein YqkB